MSKASEQSARRMKDVAYEAVKESLRAVVRCSDTFPPLKSAGQAILEVVERYDVSHDFFQSLFVDDNSRFAGGKGDTKGTCNAR